jgi:hypothetical protein
MAQMAKYDIQKQYIDASSHLQMQKTALESAKNMRIAYEKELKTIKFDFERTNRGWKQSRREAARFSLPNLRNYKRNGKVSRSGILKRYDKTKRHKRSD